MKTGCRDRATKDKHIEPCRHGHKRKSLLYPEPLQSDSGKVKNFCGKIEKAKRPFQYGKRKQKKKGNKNMKNRIMKSGNGYKIIRENDNGTKTVIAILAKEKNGYTKKIYHEPTKTWITPPYFSYFPTLKAAKRFYEIS